MPSDRHTRANLFARGGDGRACVVGIAQVHYVLLLELELLWLDAEDRLDELEDCELDDD